MKVNLQKDPRPVESQLSVTDWVTFLSSEKSAGMGNIVGFAAIFIAIIVYIFGDGSAAGSSPAPEGYAWVKPVAIVILGVAVIFFALTTFKILGKSASKTQKLLDGIMRGDETLKTESQIREAWIALNPKKQPKKK